MALRGGPDVVGRGERRAEREPLVDADRVGADLLGLADEPLPHLTLVRIAVVEPPAVAVALEGVGEVRERLPCGDRVARGRVLHRVERCVELPDVGQRLAVQQDALVLAQVRGDLPRQVHHVVALRAPLGEDRQRREHEHVRVRAQEHQLEEMLDREARARVVLAAVLLRERRPEVLPVQHRVQVVLEQMPLDVEDELLAAQRLERALGLDRRARRHLVRAAGRRARRARRRRPGRVLLGGARVEREERGRRAADREQELSPRHAEPVGILGRPGRRPIDRLAQHRRQPGFRVVLPVGSRPELDRQPRIEVVALRHVSSSRRPRAPCVLERPSHMSGSSARLARCAWRSSGTPSGSGSAPSTASRQPARSRIRPRTGKRRAAAAPWRPPSSPP